EKEDFLNIYNGARALLWVAPLSWDTKLEIFAQKVANKSNPSCSESRGPSPYGQNIMAEYFVAHDVAGAWFREKDYYNSTTNSCMNGQDCTHYTQMVWENSVRIGCAIGVCGGGLPITNCQYDPPGNIPGEAPY
ncbi:Pathogenesis-related protein 1A, partial [Bienertia sinuspersici]